jgi:uncharacterized protein YecE (DUF72 family)
MFGVPDEGTHSTHVTHSTNAARNVARVQCEAVDPAPEPIALAARALPTGVFLGTSSWSFPGWQGLVYKNAYSSTALANDGLRAYSASPLLKAVGIDRSFYAPLDAQTYRDYAAQVPDTFRFVVKAPSLVCDAAIRGTGGMPSGLNSGFLDAAMAAAQFVTPCLEGLAEKAGALVFQLSPLPNAMLADIPRLIERLARFFAALPKAGAAHYALEIRDPVLLTPRLIRMLRDHGVRYCVGIHSRMPDVDRQAAALAMLDAEQAGPLIVRWSLHAGLRYEGAKARYEPFNAIVDPDLPSRQKLAALIVAALRRNQSSFVIVNNKAEGSSPLSCAWLAIAVAALWSTTTHAGDADAHARTAPPA